MLIVMILLNLLTLACVLTTDFICLKKRSRFPDTRVGYHVREAMTDQAAWEQGNDMAGRICLIGGIAGFLLLPGLLWLLRVPRWGLLAAYFGVVLVLFPMIILLPVQKIHQIRKE